MRVKKRGGRTYLYRSRWVPKGNADDHGYSVQDYIGALPSGATVVPANLAEQLTGAELLQLEAVVCAPARLAARRAREEAESREHDPLWRIDEATRLLAEAAELSHRRRVPQLRLASAHAALGQVLASDELPQKVKSHPSADSLAAALAAVRMATQAVQDGAYGHAPMEGVRRTRPYRLWAELIDAVAGDRGSLLRALQLRGFAKKKSAR
jgi:hypothetical protein